MCKQWKLYRTLFNQEMYPLRQMPHLHNKKTIAMHTKQLQKYNQHNENVRFKHNRKHIEIKEQNR